MNELQRPGLSTSSKGGSLFNKIMVGFQSLEGEGGDQPFGAPGNAEGTTSERQILDLAKFIVLSNK